MKCLSGAVDEGCFRADGVGFLGGRSGHCSGIRTGLILCPALLVFSPTLFNFAGS